ncbi:hypothetical protein TcG_02315 [Trypanosoma cruzi]|uniref:Uncharacterized protein n=1 Tax=Trypanosoma cruzi TaxID=5693 RepID=A0A2V2VMF4_TRYCR|nr:hypothetical protein BCY84_01031 [Trypanosoma cruzi cruzi]PWU96602.1 hypothetical protein C4B63_18g338 [Trypanosoma cruzi]RNF22215.1 hypothetical protein TcG_02315 [Trypanosoma cruzi]
MYSYGNGDLDSQVQRLFANVDYQLEQWNKKYGSKNFCVAPDEAHSVERNTHASDATPQLNADRKCLGCMQRTAAPSSTHNYNGENQNYKTPTSYSNEEAGVDVSALAARVSLLEERLRVADNERVDLRNRLDAAQRQISDLLEAYKALQNEQFASRMQTLSQPQYDDAQETKRGDRSRLTDDTVTPTRNFSSVMHSGSSNLTSTEFVSPHAVSRALESHVSGEALGAEMWTRTPSQKSSAQERKMLLEQLARRLSAPSSS